MIDHSCLGKTTKIQERRYSVLSLLIKGAKPREIANLLSLSDNQVKNDIFHLTNTPLHNTTIDIAKDFNTSWYEIKIRELEWGLKNFNEDSKSWIATQELIRKYKADSLKLQGLMNEKVEHSGTIVTIVDDIPKPNKVPDKVIDDIPSKTEKPDSE